MIIALIVLVLLSGGLNAPNLDLSDPAVLVEFQKDVATIIEDPSRATTVSNAVYHLNVMSFKSRSAKGAIEQEIIDFDKVASNYSATPAEVHAALKELEQSLVNVSRSTIDGREVIRQNTTKKEWKKLIKTLAKK